MPQFRQQHAREDINRQPNFLLPERCSESMPHTCLHALPTVDRKERSICAPRTQCEMSMRKITFHAVLQSILKSNKRDLLLRYSPSRWAFASIDTKSRPLIWAHPVTPGNTQWTPRMDRAIVNSFSASITGLGPTKLISPFRMFNNCGISSKLAFLNHRPIPVT